MRKHYVFAGMIAMACLCTFSCKKKETTSPQQVNNNTQQNNTQSQKKTYLAGTTSKTWHISKVLSGGADQTGAYQACVLDNNYVYSADGKFEENEGATKCNMNDPQVPASGTWELSSDEKQLTTKYSNSSPSTENILELTATTLRVGGTYNGTAWEIDYKAQ